MSRPIAKAIEGVLEQGDLAALATLVEGTNAVGAKLLVTDAGAIIGSVGDEALDRAVTRFAARFLESRDEAHTFGVAEFAPELNTNADVKILFERIEPEPRIVICGAGHVGASLARLASSVGYRVTLLDDRAEFLTRAL